MIEPALLVARGPGEGGQPGSRASGGSGQQLHGAEREKLSCDCGQEGVDTSCGNVARQQRIEVAAFNGKMPSPSSERPRDDPWRTIEDDVEADVPLREFIAYPLPLAVRSESLFSQTIPQQPTKHCLAAAVPDDPRRCRVHIRLARIRRPDDVRAET